MFPLLDIWSTVKPNNLAFSLVFKPRQLTFGLRLAIFKMLLVFIDSNKQFAECGSTPIKNADELQSIGYSIVIFPGGLIRAFTHMALEYFDSLKKHGSNEPFYSRMLDFKELNELLGTDEIIDIGKKYDPSSLNK